MKISFKKYDQAKDFDRINEFIVSNYTIAYPNIWSIERWNYAYYFVKPMFETSEEKWEKSVGIWENEENEIVGFACNEAIGFGEAFLQYIPERITESIVEEMIDFIDSNLFAEKDNKKIIKLRVLDDDNFIESIIQKHGYVKKEDSAETTTYVDLDRDFILPDLPPHFKIQSMADENDLVKRTLTFAKAFGNYGTEHEVLPHCYVELQKCPIYRKDLDVYIIGPDGEYVSFCLIWYDKKNKIGILEPVGTNPKYRKMGLAKAVVYEAINRAKKEVAERVYVGDGQQFYLSIGFRKSHRHTIWIKEF